jgi:hypothetical protein
MSMFYVTNKNEDVHEDRYDGEDFVFPPGERVLLSEDAARHMFGKGLVDKTDTLLRLGWANKIDPVKKVYVENTEGVKRLANFVFEEAVMMPKSLLPSVEPDIA